MLIFKCRGEPSIIFLYSLTKTMSVLSKCVKPFQSTISEAMMVCFLCQANSGLHTCKKKNRTGSTFTELDIPNRQRWPQVSVVVRWKLQYRCQEISVFSAVTGLPDRFDQSLNNSFCPPQSC